MSIEVLMPKLGLTMQEGIIEEWLVEPGTPVTNGDPLLRLSTDKVDVEVEAEGTGRFFPAVDAGAVLPPGAVVGWLLAEGEQPPVAGEPGADAGSGDAQSSNGARSSSELGESPEVVPAESHGTGARLKSSPYARLRARELHVDLGSVRGSGPGGRIVAFDVQERASAAAQSSAGTLSAVGSPLVRRQAKALRVDLATVEPTGAGGRIRRADVDAAAQLRRNPEPVEPAGGDPAPTVIPLKGMRGAIARAMTASLQQMAQLTHGYEVDVSRLVELRAQLKLEADAQLALPTVTDFIVRACAVALHEHPMLNASVQGEEIHVYQQVHVGLAVAVPDGLLVPVIRHADRGSLIALAQQTGRLATAARTGKLAATDLDGATFAVSTLGAYGVDFFTPVINPGNAAIMGVGRIRDGVRWEDEVPHRTSVLTLSLTFDHRVVDGAPAAEYLKTVGGLLERPTLLLAGTV